MEKLFSHGHKILHLPTLKILPANLDPIDTKSMMHLFLQVLMPLGILKF